ncbi:uncharacterized protein LOC124197394 [Daphnia pulex]|uniref:uncharacterized protein LOC124197394 n=1 Tax=Daphnia pulex TaxID=6669 RepID=UPI001EDF2097|nr:uncharacterized protein LOC124197394 [Daphnia pulex]
MKQTIILIFVSLMADGLSASDQQPTTWTNPYFYYHYNTPLDLPTQKVSTDEKAGNQQQVFTNYNDHSMQNTLGSHVILLTTCLRDLKTTKADLVHSHTEVENVKKELHQLKENSQLNSTSANLLADVMATFENMKTTVENIKKEMTGLITKADLVQTTQRLDETHISRVESVKKELANVMTTVENMKKDTNNESAAASIGRMPKSCDDLQKIGHRKSGLFSVMGNKTVDNVYCDFTKSVNDAGFQKLIGYFDVKTSPVYFHAQRTSSYHMNLNAPIPFDLFRLNLGNAMNTNGIFVAPTSGKYLFVYSGLSEHNAIARVELQVKTDTKDWSRVGQAWGDQNAQTFSLQTTLELAKGNQIRLMLLQGAIHDHESHYTNFIGQLLEEDIIQ